MPIKAGPLFRNPGGRSRSPDVQTPPPTRPNPPSPSSWRDVFDPPAPLRAHRTNAGLMAVAPRLAARDMSLWGICLRCQTVVYLDWTGTRDIQTMQKATRKGAARLGDAVACENLNVFPPYCLQILNNMIIFSGSSWPIVAQCSVCCKIFDSVRRNTFLIFRST